MGHKTRGNYKIELCTKFSCLNRNIKCKKCILYSEYLESIEPVKEDYVYRMENK